MREFEGRVVLVTGASRGIGKAAALALLDAGAHVVATAREVEALRGLRAERLIPVACELASVEDIAGLVVLVAERFGRLDGLFGNAGILGGKARVAELGLDDFRQALDVNLTANFLLLKLCHPLLRASDAGRALFVTSGVAWKRHAGWTPYAVSKAGLEALVGVYAKEVEDTPIRANLLSPGPIRTEMRSEAWPEEDPATVPPPEALLPAILRMLSPAFAENGVIYDFKAHRHVRPLPPG